MDMWGASITLVNGAHHFLLFGDDFSSFQWLHVMNQNSEVDQLFKHCDALVERKFSNFIK